MIRKKPAPHLMRGVQRFSEKIMRKRRDRKRPRDTQDTAGPLPDGEGLGHRKSAERSQSSARGKNARVMIWHRVTP